MYRSLLGLSLVNSSGLGEGEFRDSEVDVGLDLILGKLVVLINEGLLLLIYAGPCKQENEGCRFGKLRKMRVRIIN